MTLFDLKRFIYKLVNRNINFNSKRYSPKSAYCNVNPPPQVITNTKIKRNPQSVVFDAANIACHFGNLFTKQIVSKIAQIVNKVGNKETSIKKENNKKPIFNAWNTIDSSEWIIDNIAINIYNKYRNNLSLQKNKLFLNNVRFKSNIFKTIAIYEFVPIFIKLYILKFNPMSCVVILHKNFKIHGDSLINDKNHTPSNIYTCDCFKKNPTNSCNDHFIKYHSVYNTFKEDIEQIENETATNISIQSAVNQDDDESILCCSNTFFFEKNTDDLHFFIINPALKYKKHCKLTDDDARAIIKNHRIVEHPFNTFDEYLFTFKQYSWYEKIPNSNFPIIVTNDQFKDVIWPGPRRDIISNIKFELKLTSFGIHLDFITHPKLDLFISMFISKMNIPRQTLATPVVTEPGLVCINPNLIPKNNIPSAPKSAMKKTPSNNSLDKKASNNDNVSQKQFCINQDRNRTIIFD